MKIEEAVPGRWVEHHGLRLRILAVSSAPASQVVAENSTGGVYCNGAAAFTLLPEECDSFDWHTAPVESPDDWVTQDRVNCRRCDQIRWIRHDGTVQIDWQPVDKALHDLWHGHIERCRRKDLPPVPEPEKPAIDPGEGYRLLDDDEGTQPTDEREYADEYTNEWLELGRLSSSCRTVAEWRAAVPSMIIRRKIEPVKPATRKVVLTEWLLERDGEAFLMIKSDKPVGLQSDTITAIGTREIEVPLQ